LYYLFLVAVCYSVPSLAIDFSSKLISREKSITSEPVISESGLAAWVYYDTNDAVTAHSHIAIYYNDVRSDLTDELIGSFYGATKPCVQSNKLVFVAGYKTIDPEGINWTLREVINRDEGDIKEINANYSATEIDGIQILEPYTMQTNDPNDAVVPAIGIDTNAARRNPSGEAEIWSWKVGDMEIERVTQDTRNDFAPAFWGDTIAWQKAKGWPFGWEIMATVGTEMMQLTTNYYYDMGAKVHGNKIVWYGWDGFDYEIYMTDTEKGETIQITSNRYDDVAPMIWDNVIVWEGYQAVEADIFIWKEGTITKISNNIDDDLYPRIWQSKVVWQGFDGDDFEIYYYDVDKGGEAIKITSNNYDDTNPEIFDNLLVWMGYEGNWDSEIFYVETGNLSVSDIKPAQLTNNEEDDRDAKTAGRKIIWVTEIDGQGAIMLAEPK